MKLFFAALFLIAGTNAALADPTGGILTAAIASSILTAGGPLVIGAAAVNSAFFIGSVIAGAAGVALNIGLAYGASRLLAPGGGANAGNPINSPGVRGTIKQASAPQRIVFGRNKIGGIVYLYEVIPPKLYLGIIYSSMPIRNWGAITVEEQEVVFSRSGSIWTPIAPPFLVGSNNRIRVAFQEGTLDQPVNPLAAVARPDLGADFRLPGLANAVWEFDYGADFDEFQALWGQVQIPNPLVETVNGVPIYDPRKPLQRWPDDWRDAEDVADAIDTWQPTRNAALIQAFWRAAPFGLQAGYDGTDWDRVAKAANFDDQPIGTADGEFIPRGTIDGVVTLDQQPNSVMDSMLTANRGFQVRKAGKGWIEPAMPKEPIFTITDSHIVGAIQFRRDRAKRDRITKVSSLFVSPDRQFTEVETPAYLRPDLIDDDGEELERKIRLPFTGRHQNAQRLQKEILDESLLERSLSLAVSMKCFGLREGDVVRVASVKYPHIDGIYQIEEWGLAENRAALSLTMGEFDKTIPVRWTPADEQEFPDLAEAA